MKFTACYTKLAPASTVAVWIQHWQCSTVAVWIQHWQCKECQWI